MHRFECCCLRGGRVFPLTFKTLNKVCSIHRIKTTILVKIDRFRRGKPFERLAKGWFLSILAGAFHDSAWWPFQDMHKATVQVQRRIGVDSVVLYDCCLIWNSHDDHLEICTKNPLNLSLYL